MILRVEISVADIAVGRKVLPVPLGQGQGVELGRTQWIEADPVLESCSVGEKSRGAKEEQPGWEASSMDPDVESIPVVQTQGEQGCTHELGGMCCT